MDMEKLTKQQIVLVTLLVSFVTSIATGIVTVALMDQMPPGVTQTINRVVERTIEKVVTPPTSGNAAAVVTRETIIVKEDDKVVESVDKNKQSVVRIYTKNDDVDQRVFVGLGSIVSKNGLIAAGEVFADINGQYMIQTDNKNWYNVSVLFKKDGAQFYFLKVLQDDKNPVTFVPINLSDSDSLKLGQTVIAWGGLTQNSVFTGIISSVVDIEGKLDQTDVTASTTPVTPPREIVAINTSINTADALSGAPLLNLSGEVVGLRVSPNISQYSFLPSNILKKEIAAIMAL